MRERPSLSAAGDAKAATATRADARVSNWRISNWRALARTGLALAAAGTFLAFLAPFRTDVLGWPLVWVYWVGLIGFGAIATGGARWAVRRLQTEMAFLDAAGVWGQNAAVTVLASVPIAAVLLVVNRALGATAPPSVWPRYYLSAVAITGAMVGIGALIRAVKQAGADPPGASRVVADGIGSSDADQRLRALLPPALRDARFWALQAEDHYVRVHTSAGGALVLMRLADAEAALAGADGMRVHRSWWVAREAVREAQRGDGPMTLTLANGVTAPVSRTYARRVREAGWV